MSNNKSYHCKAGSTLLVEMCARNPQQDRRYPASIVKDSAKSLTEESYLMPGNCGERVIRRLRSNVPNWMAAYVSLMFIRFYLILHKITSVDGF